MDICILLGAYEFEIHHFTEIHIQYEFEIFSPNIEFILQVNIDLIYRYRIDVIQIQFLYIKMNRFISFKLLVHSSYFHG